MDEPVKPFVCHEPGCGESFTIADRLAVHSKKHDLVLQLGNKGGAFVADQTPTPTRFIRNCEEVGLFQDLQHVNIFEDSFKREMESRSNIHHLGLDNHENHDSHLTTSITSDDTLHTPHIFPHMPDDSSTSVFLHKPEEGPNLNESRHTNDDIEHSSISKCLKRNAEENLPRFEMNDKSCMHIVENNSQARKIPIRSRLKLMRQNSVDLEDSDSPTIAIKEITHKIQENPPQEGLKSRRIIQRNSLRDIRIPVVSISDSSRNNTVINNGQVVDQMPNKPEFKSQIQIKDNSLLTVPDMIDKNNLRNSIKGNMLKLISQKSIDIELVKFANEANDRTVDMNNISIEELPSINELNNDPATKSHCTDAQINLLETQQSFIESSNMLNSNIAYAGKEKNALTTCSGGDNLYIQSKLLNTEVNFSSNMNLSSSPVHNTSNLKAVRRKTVISQKESNQTIDTNQSDGYELLLKWPDGKKVYLKEVYRDDDVDELKTCNTSKVLPNSLTLLPNDNNKVDSESVASKRKMHDSVQVNVKRLTQSHVNPKLPIKPLSSENCLKECLILPQTFITNKLSSPHIMKNSIQVLPIGTILQSGDILSPTIIKDRSLGNSPSISVIHSQLNNPCIIQKINNANKPTKRKDPDFSTIKNNTMKGNKSNDLSKVDANKMDEQKKDHIQYRNRAAVNRYRNRQKQMHKVTQQRNEELENLNKDLSEKLNQALDEVKRLQDILALHNNCTVNISAHNNIGVIQPTEMFNRKFEKKSDHVH